MEIPYSKLDHETLMALIEDFATRDGTDYGERECSLEQKSKQIYQKIVRGELAIVFDNYTQSCGLITKDSMKKAGHSPVVVK